MDEKERTKLRAEVMNSSLSAQLIELTVRKMGVNGLSDEALKRCAAIAKALEEELKKPPLKLE